MVVLRADPWMPDYGMGYQASAEESPLPDADALVETPHWAAPILPRRGDGREERVSFVDGVRRVEVRLLADEGGRRVPGLFGSFAVGVVRCDGRATFGEDRVCRSVVLGGGVVPQRVVVPCGHATLEFDPVAEPGTEPNEPLDRLQLLMREAEESMAAHVAGSSEGLVIADGPLRFGEESGRPVVGVVKRLVRRYLEPAREALLGILGAGERTPLFALLDREGTVRRYSWYARLATLLPPWHDHAGIVRCEVGAAVGLDAAVDLADRVTRMLPAYAGRPADPRTPQNLAPVAGLEARLRHRMGDRALVRRALLSWLAGEGVMDHGAG